MLTHHPKLKLFLPQNQLNFVDLTRFAKHLILPKSTYTFFIICLEGVHSFEHLHVETARLIKAYALYVQSNVPAPRRRPRAYLIVDTFASLARQLLDFRVTYLSVT